MSIMNSKQDQKTIEVPARYRHLKSGNVYTTMWAGKMKYQGVWHTSITYHRDCKIYTRTIDNFNRSFELDE